MMQTTFIPAILLQKPFCEIDSFSKLAIMMIFKIFKQENKASHILPILTHIKKIKSAMTWSQI